MKFPQLPEIPVWLKEATLALFRYLLLAATSTALDMLVNGNFSLRGLGIALAIAALTYIQELMHEKGKATRNKSLSKGLTRF